MRTAHHGTEKVLITPTVLNHETKILLDLKKRKRTELKEESPSHLSFCLIIKIMSPGKISLTQISLSFYNTVFRTHTTVKHFTLLFYKAILRQSSPVVIFLCMYHTGTRISLM